MSKYKSYDNNKRKISKLVNDQNNLQSKIDQRKILRPNLVKKLILSEPINLPFKIPIDLSIDFSPMGFFYEGTTALFQTWQIVFEKIDIKLIPYLKTEFVYRIGNGDGIPIDDTRFHPSSSNLLGFSSSFIINEVYQEIDLDNEPDNIKKVIYNKSLYVAPFSFSNLPDFEVKLYASLMYPNHMV